MRRDSPNSLVQCVCHVPPGDWTFLPRQLWWEGICHITCSGLDRNGLTVQGDTSSIIVYRPVVNDCFWFDCLRSTERMIPKSGFWYVYKDAELFGCLTKENSIRKRYFTFIRWRMEDSHMCLRVVFQFAPPRCNIRHLYLPMIFFCFFFWLEHSSHKRTVILPYVSSFSWYTQAAGTRYTSLQLSLSALRSLWKIFTHTLPFPLISIFQPRIFSEPMLDFFSLPLTSATVIVNNSEYLDSMPSQTSSVPLPKALGVLPSLCASTMEILGSSYL